MRVLAFSRIVLVGGIASGLATGCGEPTPTQRALPSGKTAAKAREANPELARVRLSAPTLLSASEGSSIMVPGFSVELEEADGYEVLRCNASFVPKTPEGTPASEVTGIDAVRKDKLLWAWMNAKNNAADCKIVALNTGRDLFLDPTAPPGTFRYHAIACVDEKRLPENKRDSRCSWEIQTTPPITYDGKLQAAFLEASRNLNSAEGELNGTLLELRRLSSAIVMERELCEGAANAKKALDRMAAGALGLLKIAFAPALTAFTAGAGGAIFNFLTSANETMNAGKELAKGASGCPVVDTLAAQTAALQESLSAAGDKVIAARNAMQKLDSRYKAMDSAVQAEFKRTQATQGGK